MRQSIYLDFAAATPVDKAGLLASQAYLQDNFFNPSAIYQSAREVRQAVESARGKVASVIGSKDQEVVFTAGGTEANNLAIKGLMDLFKDSHIVFSSIEHESVIEPAKQYNHSILPVKPNGIIDIDKLKSLINDSTVLVSVMYANNEIGTVQPLKAVIGLINAVRTQRINSGNKLPIYLHTDACQAANYLDLQVTRLGVDLMTLNGGKIYSFKQSGCLYVNKSVKLKPLIYGGGQESSLRSGTENVPALLSFATMLQKVQNQRKQQTKNQEQLRDKLFAIISQNINDVQINGDVKKRLPNNLNILIPHLDGERLVMELDEAGVMAATGSACTAGSDEPSYVLRAIGLSNNEASSSLRLSLGRQTTETDINSAGQIIVDTVKKMQKLV